MSTPAGVLPSEGANWLSTVTRAGDTGTVTVVLVCVPLTLTVKLSVSGPVVRSAANRAARVGL